MRQLSRVVMLSVACLLMAGVACHGDARAEALVTSEDALVVGARLCTRKMPPLEEKYGIPRHLMMAIGSNESGRYHKGLNAVIPWPWTVNAEGRGYYFASKEEAIAAVRRMQLQGIQSMDVGCMQVNLKHHANAFSSLQNAFDPQSNVAYAAQFLRRNFEATNSWSKAVAYYHSQTPKFGVPYSQAVYARWNKILARAGKTPQQAMASAIAAGSLTPQTAAELAQYASAASARSNAVSRPTARVRSGLRSGVAMRREAPHMKVIKVYRSDSEPNMVAYSNASDDDHGVTVIRMDRGRGEPMQTASAAESHERSAVSAVSSMIIQDIAEAQAADTSPSTQTEAGVAVTRGQFTPRAARSISSGSDDGFVIRN